MKLEANKKTILITGVTGYIGSNLVKTIYKDYNCFGVIRRTSNVEKIKDFCQLVYVDEMEDCFRNNKIDLVIHLATNYGRFGDDFYEIVSDNLMYPALILQLIKKYGIDRFINCDTCLKEEVNYYSLSKKQFVQWLKMLKIKTTNIILQHFYGPNNTNNDFISFLIKSLRGDESINLTVGTQKRDFIYIDDVISAIRVIVDQKFDDSFVDIDVGSGFSITIKELAIKIKKITRSNATLNFGSVKMRDGDSDEYVANIDYLRSFGWKPSISLEDGLINCL